MVKCQAQPAVGANVIHDGSEEVVGAFPETAPSFQGTYGGVSGPNLGGMHGRERDSGFWRFWFCRALFLHRQS